MRYSFFLITLQDPLSFSRSSLVPPEAHVFAAEVVFHLLEAISPALLEPRDFLLRNLVKNCFRPRQSRRSKTQTARSQFPISRTKILK